MAKARRFGGRVAPAIFKYFSLDVVNDKTLFPTNVVYTQGWKNPVAWSPFATKKYFWRPDHRPRWSIWRLTFRPRVQFGDPSFALGSMYEQTVLYGDRKTNDRFPKTKFKISKTFLVIRVTLTWHTHTPARPIPLRIR